MANVRFERLDLLKQSSVYTWQENRMSRPAASHSKFKLGAFFIIINEGAFMVTRTVLMIFTN